MEGYTLQVALIPPVPALSKFGHGSFHLLLSHLLQDKRYFDHYQAQRKHGAYLCLDNSAHENGQGDDPEVLMFNAVALNAQEVVVPDVLDDGVATIERVTSALEKWFEHEYSPIRQLHPTLMYVPQGAHVKEWEMCLLECIRLHLFVAKRYGYRKDFVIGLSKDYEVWRGGLDNLLSNFIYPQVIRYQKQGVTIKVHLLGWGRNLWELGVLARKHTWIRSTDSAKPFVYALSGINLNNHLDELPPKYPKRPKNYFSRNLFQVEEIAKENVAVFKALADGSQMT
jgi:hypothetical protein